MLTSKTVPAVLGMWMKEKLACCGQSRRCACASNCVVSGCNPNVPAAKPVAIVRDAIPAQLLLLPVLPRVATAPELRKGSLVCPVGCTGLCVLSAELCSAIDPIQYRTTALMNRMHPQEPVDTLGCRFDSGCAGGRSLVAVKERGRVAKVSGLEHPLLALRFMAAGAAARNYWLPPDLVGGFSLQVTCTLELV